MSDTSPTQTVLDHAHELGFELAGVCSADPPVHLDVFEEWIAKGFHATMDYLPRSLPLRQDLNTLLPRVQSVVMVGINYYQPNPTEPGEPRIATYAKGRDYHKTIRSKLKKLSRFVSDLIPEIKCRVCVDSAPIFERELAVRAGLGWIGKNTCVINTKRGSWFLLGALLTTAELQSSHPALGGCGTCTKCIDACPTGAIVKSGDRWQVDSRRCISYLTIEHKGEIDEQWVEPIGDWTFGCDVCQTVCPFNHPRPSQPLRSMVTQESDFAKKKVWPNLVQLSQISQERWSKITEGSPVRRSGLEGIKRNAQINLMNNQALSQGANLRK